MKKNVAGQKIGAQMITAADGSVFTGSVTVYVTGDAGTQAVGSVGSGACTHEGNGYHTYAPAQAETNYDLIAFTFVGTGAVAATVQVYPSFPQTGDSFALIGATGSGLTTLATAANLATVAGYIDTEIADIQSRLPAALVSGRIDASVGAIAASAITAASMAADASAEIADAVWDEAIAGHLGAGSTGAALNAAGGAGDPWITPLPGAYSAGQAGKIVGDYLNAAVGSVPTATQNADALLNRDMSAVSDTNARSPLNALRFLRNKWGVAAGTLTVTKEDDTTSAWTATVSTDAAAVPIIGSDPA